jgi:hypothetical protein
MVLLLCPDDPQSTHKVIAYLLSHKVNTVRIDKSKNITVKKLYFKSARQTEVILDTKGRQIEFAKIKSCWYRGGSFSFSKKRIASAFFNYLIQEENTLASFLLGKLKEKKSLGEFSNKLISASKKTP